MATREFYQADLYTFAGGNLGSNVIRQTSGDQPLTVNGFLYPSGGSVGPFFDRKDNKAKIHQARGVQVDTLTFDILPGGATISQLNNLTWQQAIRWGLFDGCEVTLERCYMPLTDYTDTTRGTIVMFVGRFAAADMGRSIVTVSVNSHLELLNLQWPRNLFQAQCINSWGDPNCGVVQTSFMTTATVQTGSTNAALLASIAGGPYSAGTFDLGKVIFTSGALNGMVMSVRTVTFGSPATIALLSRLPQAPANGDTFQLFFGCNKSLTDSNGCPKFANTARYRGFDAVPQPIVAV